MVRKPCASSTASDSRSPTSTRAVRWRTPPARAPRHAASTAARELKAIAPETHPEGQNWRPGGAPSQVLSWAVAGLAKAGTLSIIGVYPQTARTFPIGEAMNKNLTLRMGNCNHRRYLPELLQLVRSGAVDPARILTQQQPLLSAIDAYRAFDLRRPGWLKVELLPSGAPGVRAALLSTQSLLM